jgi:hypothetical protein
LLAKGSVTPLVLLVCHPFTTAWVQVTWDARNQGRKRDRARRASKQRSQKSIGKHDSEGND